MKSNHLHTLTALIMGFGLLIAPSAHAADHVPLVLRKTVPLPKIKGGFDLMAADVAGQRLFLAAEDNSTVEVIDLKAGKHLKSLSDFNEPKWVVFRPEQNRLYVSNSDGSVRVLDSTTFAPVKRFNFREKSNNLRFDPATKELFVGVGKTFGAIAVIDTGSDTIGDEIKLADFPKQFEVEADRIFVNVPKANHVAVLDRKTRQVVATWPVVEAKENVPMGFDRAQHRLFIGCEPGTLVVLDTQTGKSVASIPIAADTDGVHYDAARHRIYVSCGAGSVDVVQQSDADHYQLAARVVTAPGAGTSLFIPQLNRLCVAVPQKDKQSAELRIYEVRD